MNGKIIVAAAASTVVTFLLGWLIFGVLLMNFYTSHSMHYDGLLKNPPIMWSIIAANLAWGLSSAYILHLAGIKSISKGFITGFIVFGLYCAGRNGMDYAFMNMMGLKMLALDTALSAFMGGVSGAVIGFIYSRNGGNN